MKLSIQKSALEDLRQGFQFYEKQGAGLGSYFLDSLFSDIDALLLHAGSHPIHFGRFFRVRSARFPFAIYYEINGEAVLIRAVLDLRREPKWIERKLGKLT